MQEYENGEPVALLVMDYPNMHAKKKKNTHAFKTRTHANMVCVYIERGYNFLKKHKDTGHRTVIHVELLRLFMRA